MKCSSDPTTPPLSIKKKGIIKKKWHLTTFRLLSKKIGKNLENSGKTRKKIGRNFFFKLGKKVSRIIIRPALTFEPSPVPYQPNHLTLRKQSCSRPPPWEVEKEMLTLLEENHKVRRENEALRTKLTKAVGKKELTEILSNKKKSFYMDHMKLLGPYTTKLFIPR